MLDFFHSCMEETSMKGFSARRGKDERMNEWMDGGGSGTHPIQAGFGRAIEFSLECLLPPQFQFAVLLVCARMAWRMSEWEGGVWPGLGESITHLLSDG
jgi:hypothetical protein